MNKAWRADALLRSPRWASLMKFGATGVVSVGVAMGGTALLHELGGVAAPIAAAAGLAAALTVNFFMLRYVVFHGTVVRLHRQLIGYVGSAGIFRGLEYLGFLLLNVVLGIDYLVALGVVLCVSFLLKFMVYDRWIFARAGGVATESRGGELP